MRISAKGTRRETMLGVFDGNFLVCENESFQFIMDAGTKFLDPWNFINYLKIASNVLRRYSTNDIIPSWKLFFTERKE